MSSLQSHNCRTALQLLYAKEINGRVEKLDPCETILPESPDTTYFQRQMRNLATLSKVLSEGAKKS